MVRIRVRVRARARVRVRLELRLGRSQDTTKSRAGYNGVGLEKTVMKGEGTRRSKVATGIDGRKGDTEEQDCHSH